MRHRDGGSHAGKAIGAGFCAVCCVAPMLVVLGVVSLATLLAVGLAAAAIVGLSLLAWAVAAGRIGSAEPRIGRTLGAAGAVVAVWSLLFDRNRSGLVIGVALMAAGALLVLAAVHSSTTREVARDQ